MLAAEQSSRGMWSMANVGNHGALGSLVFGDHSWVGPTIAVAAGGILLALWVSRHRPASLGLATFCRIIGWLLITACLVNPLWSSARPRRGANVLAVVTDISRSHLVTTSGTQTRADILQELLNHCNIT